MFAYAHLQLRGMLENGFLRSVFFVRKFLKREPFESKVKWQRKERDQWRMIHTVNAWLPSFGIFKMSSCLGRPSEPVRSKTLFLLVSRTSSSRKQLPSSLKLIWNRAGIKNAHTETSPVMLCLASIFGSFDAFTGD